MILNRTAGGQKKYRITNKSGYIDCGTQQVSAGATVKVSIRGSVGITVQTTSGLTIPVEFGDIAMYAPEIPVSAYFVMPAEDVTIS